MPKPKSFDQDTALNAAMQLFWKQGFKRTSMRELEQHTGLSAGSIYHSFGSKQKLFAAALSHYIDNIIAARIVRLETDMAQNPVAAIRQFLVSAFQDVPEIFRHQSCFLVNSATEIGQSDHVIGSIIRQGFQTIEHALEKAILNSNIAGGPSHARLLAAQLAMLLPGLLIAAKNETPEAHLAAIVDFNLRQIGMTNTSTTVKKGEPDHD